MMRVKSERIAGADAEFFFFWWREGGKDVKIKMIFKMFT